MRKPENQGPIMAVIPARGGSKRIPRKNIRPFVGIPMLSRTIELIRAARLFNHIIVSTDDEEIAHIAQEAGAEVPFRRPAELSNDMAGTMPVVAHAINEMELRGVTTKWVCCVYPASVLSRRSDLHAAYDMLEDDGVDFVFTATVFPYPIQRALRKSPSGRCQMFWPENRETRSQDLEPAYHDAGQFYIGRRDAWLQARPIFGSHSKMLELPHYRVQDIDTLDDWMRAEAIFRLSEKDGRDV